MASTYTVNIGIEKPGTGDQSGTWGVTTNTNFDIIDQATNGVATVTLAAAGTSGSPNTLLINNGALSDGRNRFIEFNDGADLGATAYVQLDPNDAEKIVHIRNSLSASRSLILFQGTYNASNDFEVPNGADVLVKFDGGGAGATVTDVNVNLTPTKLTTSDADINGGNIDGTTIGASSAAAITGTTITGTSFVSSGDMTFGDNDKAIFGAGSDLQIYHDGTNSYIDDAGSGILWIRGDASVRIGKAGTTEVGLRVESDSYTKLYYDNAEKLATTSTGIEVTGKVLADVLAVGDDEPISLRSGLDSFDDIIRDSTGNATIIRARNDVRVNLDSNNDSTTAASFVVGYDGIDTSTKKALEVKEGGDISFYADDGTTQGLFWDASTQNLGLGVTSPSTTLHVKGGTNENVMIVDATGTAANYIFDVRDDGTSKFRVDPSGNVGIGTSSPSKKLDVDGQFRIRNGGATGYALLEYGASATATNNWHVGSEGDGSFRFYSGNFGAGTERMRIDGSGNVGIGVAPFANNIGNGLDIADGAGMFGSSNSNYLTANLYYSSGWKYKASASGSMALLDGAGSIKFHTAPAGSAGAAATLTERMRIDSSGNLLVSTTTVNTDGITLNADDYIYTSRTSGASLFVNRNTSDGTLVDFRKGGSNVGSIGAWSSGLLVGTGDVGLAFVDGTPERIQPRKADDQTSADGLIDLGHSSNRFKDLYLSGGVYLGGTAAANKLDSYEEGAWTPSLEGSTGALTSITYVSRDGHYRKIGDTVIVWWDIQQTNISGGSGAIQIPLSDLPFTPSFSLNGGREIASGAAQTFLVPWPHDGTIGTRFEPSEGIQFQISRNNGTWSTITTANASGAGKYWGGHLIYRTTAT